MWLFGIKSRPTYPSLTQLARVPDFYPGSFGFESQAGDPASLAQQDGAVPFYGNGPGVRMPGGAKHKSVGGTDNSPGLNQENAGSTPARSTAPSSMGKMRDFHFREPGSSPGGAAAG